MVIVPLGDRGSVSLYNAAGNPHTGQPGSVFRQIACRNANAVCNAVGSPRNTVYPATARE